MMMVMSIYNTKTFEGVVNNLERRYLETDSEWKEKRSPNTKVSSIVKM